MAYTTSVEKHGINLDEQPRKSPSNRKHKDSMKNGTNGWLTLTQTAELLGVHPNTVRVWSDKGQIPVHRTEGKHRRYLRSEIELWAQANRQSSVGGSENIVQLALGQIRFHISEGRLESEQWYQKLDEEARQQYRRSGIVLVQGLMNYLTSEGEDAMTEAISLGYEYASRGQRHELDHIDAVRAFLFFRNMLLEAMVNVYRDSKVPSGAVWEEMLHKFHTFTDQIMISLLETYQAFEINHI